MVVKTAILDWLALVPNFMGGTDGHAHLAQLPVTQSA